MIEVVFVDELLVHLNNHNLQPQPLQPQPPQPPQPQQPPQNQLNNGTNFYSSQAIQGGLYSQQQLNQIINSLIIIMEINILIFNYIK